MELKRFDGKRVRIVTADGEVFEGIKRYFPALERQQNTPRGKRKQLLLALAFFIFLSRLTHLVLRPKPRRRKVLRMKAL
ncbi:MAG: hypothetical protein K6F09_00540 [Clostridiales bacterium]|nr:hypothetical protein [Clostridiales bacterium]